MVDDLGGLSVQDFQLLAGVEEAVDELGRDPADDGEHDQEGGGKAEEDQQFLLPHREFPAPATATVMMAMAVVMALAVRAMAVRVTMALAIGTVVMVMMVLLGSSFGFGSIGGHRLSGCGCRG